MAVTQIGRNCTYIVDVYYTRSGHKAGNDRYRTKIGKSYILLSSRSIGSRLTPYIVRASVRHSLRYDEHIELDISMKLWSIANKIAVKRENTQ